MTTDTNERGTMNETLQGGKKATVVAPTTPPTTPPAGPAPSSPEVKQFTITPGQTTPVQITVEDTMITGNLSITKKDQNGNVVAGATFEIENSSGASVGTVTTNAQGQASLPNLPYGNYTLVETAVPAGYVLNDTPIPFTITTNGATVTQNVLNTAITGTLSIIKTDKTTGKVLAGATFQVKNAQGVVVATETTNAQGQITVPNLPYGNYTLVETAVPTGYVLNSTPVPFSITTNGATVTQNIANAIITGTLSITKTDKQTGKPIAGVIFNIENSSGVSVGTVTTNAQGQASLPNLPYGNYTLVETSVPAGYVLNATPIPFTINVNGQVVSQAITNNEAPGELVIRKVDATTGAALAGAVFNITNSSGSSAGTITTGSNGEGTISLLPGSYTATETKAPIGYVLNTTPQNFTIGFNQTSPSILTFSDVEQLCKVVITKVDASNNSKLLAGAEFDIINAQGQVVDTVTTGADGTASAELPAGTYTIKEVKAPEGYIPYVNPRQITLNELAVTDVNEIVNNIPIKGKIVIKKTDARTGEVLPCAKFIIRDAKCEVVACGCTNKEGKLRFQLPYGNYTYQEVCAPKGYKLDTTQVAFKITTNGEVIKANVKNKKIAEQSNIGTLKITKVDFCDIGKNLAGATFEIENMNGEVVGTITTNNKGIAKIKLPAGKYCVVETKAPNGYGVCRTRTYITVKSGQLAEVLSRDRKINNCYCPGQF